MTSVYDNTEEGERSVEIESKRCLVKSFALFRMIVALVTMLVSAALGGIIMRQTPSDELIADLRAKWKTTFWIYSGASLAMFLISLRLVVLMRKVNVPDIGQRQSRGVRGIVIMGLIMAIFEAYAASSAFSDSGVLRGEASTNDPNDELVAETRRSESFVSLMAISCSFIGLFLLELALLVLIVCYHRAMSNKSWSNAVESSDKCRVAAKHSDDEVQHFIQKPNEKGSTEVLQYTNEFTVAELTPDTKPGEESANHTGEEEVDGTARPLLPPPNLIVNQIYEAPDPPRPIRKIKDAPPPLPPVNAVVQRTPVDENGLSPEDRTEVGGKRIAPSPPPLPASAPPVDDSSTPDKTDIEPGQISAQIQPENHSDPTTVGPADAAPNNSEGSPVPQSAVPAEGRTSPKIQRQSSFKRYEGRSSLRRKPSSSGTNPNFPLYSGTRFGSYDPERGIFAQPVAQLDDL